MLASIESMGQLAIALFIGAIVFAILLMIALLWFGWWVTVRHGSVSPYTRQPMKRGEDVAASTVRLIHNFLQRLDPIDNPLFDLNYAAICRETGRVFPDSINHFGVIVLDWSFLKKRYKGNWISWGSLSVVQRAEVSSCHDSLEGFQTELSSPRTFPKDIDSFCAMAKPGPLYVDLATKTVMGWKCIPGTILELLIVQRPFYTRVKDENIDHLRTSLR